MAAPAAGPVPIPGVAAQPRASAPRQPIGEPVTAAPQSSRDRHDAPAVKPGQADPTTRRSWSDDKPKDGGKAPSAPPRPSQPSTVGGGRRQG
jgi:hypothetical protein